MTPFSIIFWHSCSTTRWPSALILNGLCFTGRFSPVSMVCMPASERPSRPSGPMKTSWNLLSRSRTSCLSSSSRTHSELRVHKSCRKSGSSAPSSVSSAVGLPGVISDVAPSASSRIAIILLTPTLRGSLLLLVRGTITSSPAFTKAAGLCTPSGGHHTVSVISPEGGFLLAFDRLTS